MTNFTKTSESVVRFAQTLRNVGMDDGESVAEQVLEIARQVGAGELSAEDAEKLLEEMARSMADSLVERTSGSEMDSVLDSLLNDNVLTLTIREYRELAGEGMDEDDMERVKEMIQAMHLQEFIEAALGGAMMGFRADAGQRNTMLDYIVRVTTMGVAKILAKVLVTHREAREIMSKQVRMLLDPDAMARAARNHVK